MTPMCAVAARKFSTQWKNNPRFFHAMEKMFPHRGKIGPFFPRCGKLFSTVWKTFLTFSLATSAAASPFSVSAARDVFAAQPAIRLDFTVPADHHLYSSFSVADPSGAVLPPLAVPPPDTHNPDDPEPTYS